MTVLTTPASAFFFDDWFGEDYWQPPERTDDMDISDRDYVDLWGEISNYEEDDGQYEEFRSILQGRTDETGLTRLAEYAGGYVPNPTPLSHTVEWNNNIHKHSQEGYSYEYESKYERGHPEEGTHFRHKDTGVRYEVIASGLWNDNFPGYRNAFLHPVDEELDEDIGKPWEWKDTEGGINSPPEGVIATQSNRHIEEEFEWIPKPDESPEIIEDDRQYPPEDNVQSSDFIHTVFTDIVAITPHTYYERGASDVENISDPPEPINYIPPDPSLSITSNKEINIPDTRTTGSGLSRTQYRYSLNDSEVSLNVTARNTTAINETTRNESIESELDTNLPRNTTQSIKRNGVDENKVNRIKNMTGVNITKQNITSNVVDYRETDSITSQIDLDLDTLEAEDEVDFNSELYVWAMKDEDVYDRECTRRVNGSCVSSTWNYSHTNTYTDSIRVKHDHEDRGTIYDPIVNTTYNVQEEGNTEIYTMEVENTQPIAGVRPEGNKMARYPVSMYSFSDPDYRNSFGQVTPVKHRALPTGTSIDDSRVRSTATGSGSITYYNAPDEVTLNVDSTTVREISSARIHGRTNNFNPHNIEPVPIVPDTSPTTNTEDGQEQEFDNLELRAQYNWNQWYDNSSPDPPTHGDHEFEDGYGDYTFTTQVTLRNSLTYQPIITEEEDSLELYLHHGGLDESMKIQHQDTWEEVNIPFKTRGEGDAVPMTFRLYEDGERRLETEIKFTIFDWEERRSSSQPEDNEINIVPTDIDATYSILNETPEDQPNIYEVDIELVNEDTGDGLITEGNSDYEIVATQNANGLEKTLQTNTTGESKTTFEAYPGDYIDIQLEQQTSVYEQRENAFAPSSTTISFGIGVDGVNTGFNILIYIIQLAIPISGFVLLLSLITKGLTGSWFPN